MVNRHCSRRRRLFRRRAIKLIANVNVNSSVWNGNTNAQLHVIVPLSSDSRTFFCYKTKFICHFYYTRLAVQHVEYALVMRKRMMNGETNIQFRLRWRELSVFAVDAPYQPADYRLYGNIYPWHNWNGEKHTKESQNVRWCCSIRRLDTKSHQKARECNSSRANSLITSVLSANRREINKNCSWCDCSWFADVAAVWMETERFQLFSGKELPSGCKCVCVCRLWFTWKIKREHIMCGCECDCMIIIINNN